MQYRGARVPQHEQRGRWQVLDFFDDDNLRRVDYINNDMLTSLPIMAQSVKIVPTCCPRAPLLNPSNVKKSDLNSGYPRGINCERVYEIIEHFPSLHLQLLEVMWLINDHYNSQDWDGLCWLPAKALAPLVPPHDHNGTDGNTLSTPTVLPMIVPRENKDTIWGFGVLRYKYIDFARIIKDMSDMLDMTRRCLPALRWYLKTHTVPAAYYAQYRSLVDYLTDWSDRFRQAAACIPPYLLASNPYRCRSCQPSMYTNALYQLPVDMYLRHAASNRSEWYCLHFDEEKQCVSFRSMFWLEDLLCEWKDMIDTNVIELANMIGQHAYNNKNPSSIIIVQDFFWIRLAERALIKVFHPIEAAEKLQQQVLVAWKKQKVDNNTLFRFMVNLITVFYYLLGNHRPRTMAKRAMYCTKWWLTRLRNLPGMWSWMKKIKRIKYIRHREMRGGMPQLVPRPVISVIGAVARLIHAAKMEEDAKKAVSTEKDNQLDDTKDEDDENYVKEMRSEMNFINWYIIIWFFFVWGPIFTFFFGCFCMYACFWSWVYSPYYLVQRILRWMLKPKVVFTVDNQPARYRPYPD